MPVLDPRTRLISVRLSTTEYDRLKAVSRAHHARSLSEFLRSTICELIASSPHGGTSGMVSAPPVSSQLGPPLARVIGRDDHSSVPMGLDERLELLAREVIRLSEVVERRGPKPALGFRTAVAPESERARTGRKIPVETR